MGKRAGVRKTSTVPPPPAPAPARALHTAQSPSLLCLPPLPLHLSSIQAQTPESPCLRSLSQPRPLLLQVMLPKPISLEPRLQRHPTAQPPSPAWHTEGPSSRAPCLDSNSPPSPLWRAEPHFRSDLPSPRAPCSKGFHSPSHPLSPSHHPPQCSHCIPPALPRLPPPPDRLCCPQRRASPSRKGCLPLPDLTLDGGISTHLCGASLGSQSLLGTAQPWHFLRAFVCPEAQE